MNFSCLGPSLKLRRDINRAVAFTKIPTEPTAALGLHLDIGLVGFC
jgi:hypothetical protein